MSSLAELYKALDVKTSQAQPITPVEKTPAPTSANQPAPSTEDQKNAQKAKNVFDQLLGNGGSPQLKGG